MKNDTDFPAFSNEEQNTVRKLELMYLKPYSTPQCVVPAISGPFNTIKFMFKSNNFQLANLKEYHPAPWIWGKEKETQPAYIWYWVREGVYQEPRSCMDILTRSFSKTAAKGLIY